jgi:O-antigen/teichoic acid export membrane protein
MTKNRMNLGFNTRNFLALSANTLTLTLIQITTIPLFLHYSTFESYTIWIVTSSIAQFAGLLDFGMVAASQNSFSFLKASRKKYDVSKTVIQIFNFQISAVILFNIVIFVAERLNIFRIDCLLLFVFTLSLLVQSYFGILEATTQMNSKVYQGIHASTLGRLLEYVGIVIGCIFLGQSLVLVASIGLMLKILFLIYMIPRFETRIRILKYGSWEMRLLLKSLREGTPYLVIKLTDFLVFSGVLLVLQSRLNPADLILFASCRTFFRVGLQFTGLINHSYAYEMTRAWSLNNYAKMKHLMHISGKVTILISLAFASIYIIFGEDIFSIWTQGSMKLYLPVLLVGTCYSTICSINQSQKSNYNSINANSKVSQILLTFAIFQLLFFTFQLDKPTIEELFFYLFLFELLITIAIPFFARNDLNIKFFSR